MDKQQALAQRHANMVGEFQRCRAGAAFLAVHHDEIRQDAAFQHGLGNGHEFPRMAEAKLEAHRLAARQLTQPGNKGHHLQRSGEGAVAGGRHAVLPQRHATGGGDFRRYLVLGQNAAVAGLGPLAKLDFNHLHLRVLCLGGKALRVEMPVCIAAAKVAAAQLPYQVTAVFQMIGADAALAGVVVETALAGPLVERADGVGAECTKTHGRNIEYRGGVGLRALRATNLHPETGRVAARGRADRVTDEFEAAAIYIQQGAEGFVGLGVLGAGVNQRALVTREGQLFAIGFQQVLADFRADGFHQIADIAQHRVVAPHGVAGLGEVQHAQQAERDGCEGEGPQPFDLVQYQADQAEQDAGGEKGIAAEQGQVHAGSGRRGLNAGCYSTRVGTCAV